LPKELLALFVASSEAETINSQTFGKMCNRKLPVAVNRRDVCKHVPGRPWTVRLSKKRRRCMQHRRRDLNKNFPLSDY
jgi:hypothetical protein